MADMAWVLRKECGCGCVRVDEFATRTPWDWLPYNIFRIGCHGDYRRPRAIAKWSGQVAEVVDQFEPDLLHSWLWLADVVTAGAASLRQRPHLVHVVDRRTWLESPAWKHRYRRWLTKRLFQKADSQFVAVSRAAGQFAVNSLGIDAKRMDVAYNSIHTKMFAEIPHSDAWGLSVRPLKLGIAARIEPEKGHKYLIEAMGLLRTKRIPCTLQITGDGTDRLALERLVLENDLSEMVQFVGWVDDVAEFLSRIDVFLVPSIDSEGLPTTILEAMAAGRVVIATDVGGATEAIDHQKTGFIVKPKDANAIADAIDAISANRESAGTLALNARASINEQFSMPRMIQTIENIYARVCREENRRC